MRGRDRWYRASLWLYPRRFRREYGAAMLQLHRDRQREGAVHRRRRALGDLALSIPYQHWEALMATTPTTRATITVVATAIIAALSLAIGAAIVGLLLLLLVAWECYAVLRMRGARPDGATWWHLVAAGFGVFALVFVVFALPWPESWREEVPGDVAFGLVMIGIALSIVLVATGVLLGVTRVVAARATPTDRRR
jgi:hypothetical protein